MKLYASIAGEAESQYKEWLRDCYEDAWVKLTACLQKGTPPCKLEALNALFELLSTESKSPLKIKKNKKSKNYFPIQRLKVSTNQTLYDVFCLEVRLKNSTNYKLLLDKMYQDGYSASVIKWMKS